MRCYYGPELRAQWFIDWTEAKGIARWYIEPGKPDQNAFVERFNRTYRSEVLDAHVFATVEQVQHLTEAWIDDYNEYRLHEALGNVPPLHFLIRVTTAIASTDTCLLDR